RAVRRPPGRVGREEPGLMERRERAPLGVRGQVVLPPHVLLRARAVGDVPGVLIQYDDVPRAELEAVVSLAARPGAVAEVIERAVRCAGLILMVAERRVGARLVAAPGRVVAGLIVGGIREDVVAQRQHGSG